MNKKLLLMGLVAPALITACTNDDFVENMGNTSLNGDMINTSDLNFVVTKGEGVDTKAIWDAVEGADGQYTYSFKWEKSTPNAVGLAYVGSATGVSGVTNYKFAVDSLQLADYKSLDKKVGEVTYTTGFYQINQALSNIQTFYTKANGNSLTADDIVTSESAKFKTTNDQIMRGYYVGYYPFDEDFQDPGMIPVRTSKRLEIAKPAAGTLETANLRQVGENSFAYTAPTKLEPGSQVTYLNMQQLTSLLRLEISNTSDAALKIRTVILRTKGNDLFTIAGTLKNPAAAPAASNIDVKETSSTIAVAYPYVKDTPASTQLLEIANDADGNVYFPILPGTFNTGLDVILINQEGKACEIEYNFKNATTSFASGKGYKFSVEVTKDTKFDKSFVTSESEFMEAWDAATKSSTSYTINLLGDVVIEDEDLSFEHAGKDVVVNASAGSKLVVKNSSINLPCTLASGTTTPNGQKLIINATTEFEGLTMYGVVELNGATTFKGENQVGTTEANGDSKDAWGQLYINDEATIVKDAKINAVNSWGVIVGENATFTVDEGAEYNNLVARYGGTSGTTVYKSDLIIYGEMIVDGKLTDKGDTKIESGKLTINGSATNYNTVNGTDATIIVNGTYTNESSEGTETGKAGAGNIKITTGTLSVGTTGKLYNKASLNCMGDFVNDGTFYDYVGSVYGGKPYTSNGTYACYVNSAARLAEAYTRLGIYAKDKTQKVILQQVDGVVTSYDLSSAAAKNVNFENEGDITITSSSPVTHKIMSFTVTGENKTVTFSDDMMISGSDEIVPLTINAKAKAVFTNDIEVKINGEIINNGTFDLQPASDEDNLPATVYSTEIDVTKGTWTNYPLVQPSEAFWTGW